MGDFARKDMREVRRDRCKSRVLCKPKTRGKGRSSLSWAPAEKDRRVWTASFVGETVVTYSQKKSERRRVGGFSGDNPQMAARGGKRGRKGQRVPETIPWENSQRCVGKGGSRGRSAIIAARLCVQKTKANRKILRRGTTRDLGRKKWTPCDKERAIRKLRGARLKLFISSSR